MLGRSIRWVMLVSGALTCTMVYAAVAPRAMLQSTFGESLEGPLAELVVRNWGALIFLVGVMLIYGAFNAAVRPLVLLVAAASKVVFIALILSNGSRYLQTQAGVSIAVDSVMVVIFLAYLVTRRSATPG
jgi:predicted permease